MSQALLRRLPIAILLAGALAAWALARGREVSEVVPSLPLSPAIDVLEVEPREVRITLRAYGTVEPRTEIDLASEIAGRVQTVSPRLVTGEFFEAGELLVELDPGDAEIALLRTEAALARAQSEAHMARVKLERLSALHANQVASPAVLDEAKHTEDMGSAQLHEAQAAVSQARRDLERTRILAPFTGRVRAKQADTGQFISRGTPLARIYSVDLFEVRLPILASELRYLDLPTDEDEGSPVRLRAEFFKRGAEWRGQIVRSEGVIDPRTQMLHVVARVADPYHRSTPSSGPPLTIGLFVEAEILGSHFEDVVVLPRSALLDGSEVLVVDAEERLRARRVEVLRIETERVLLRSGVASGERVAVSASTAVDGERVRPRPVPEEYLAVLTDEFE